MNKLLIIAANKSHFRRICMQYRLQKDQVVFIGHVDQLRGIDPNHIIMFGDSWWEGWKHEDAEKIEELVEVLNEKRIKEQTK